MNKKICTRILVALLALVMIIGLLPVVSLAEGTENLVWAPVSFADLKDGDIIAITSDNATGTAEYLFDATTSNKVRPTPAAVTVTDGLLDTVAANCQLTVELGEGGIYLKNADGNYVTVNMNTSGSYLSFLTINSTTKDAAALWSWNSTKGTVGSLYSAASAMWLGVHSGSSSNSWRPINSDNSGQLTDETVTIWRYQEFVDPAVEVLNGYYALYQYNAVTEEDEYAHIGVRITPSAENALDGTLKLINYTDYDWEGKARTFSYVYAEGVLTITDTTNDGVTLPCTIDLENLTFDLGRAAYDMVKVEEPTLHVLAPQTPYSVAVAAGGEALGSFTAPADGTYYFQAASGENNAYIVVRYRDAAMNIVDGIIDDSSAFRLTLKKDQVVYLIIMTNDKKADTVDFAVNTNVAPTYDTIAEVLAGNVGTEYTIQAEVTFLDGKTVYVEDATGAMAIYMAEAPTDWAVGGTVVASGKLKFFNSLPELDGATATYTAGTATNRTHVGDYRLYADSYLCHMIQLNGVFTVTSVTGNSGYETVKMADASGREFVLYKPAKTLKVGDTVQRVTGVLSIYNDLQIRTAKASDIISTAAEGGEDDEPTYLLPPITDPKAGNAYLFGMYQNGANKVVYITGVADGEYLGVTEDSDEAALVRVEACADGLKFYVMDGEEKSYIELYKNSNNKVKVGYGETGSVFTYDEELSSWVTNYEDDEYYLGTYGTYLTIGSSYSSYVTAENKGSSQYPAGFMVFVSADNNGGNDDGGNDDGGNDDGGNTGDLNPDNGDNTYIFMMVGVASLMAMAAVVVVGKKQSF